MDHLKQTIPTTNEEFISEAVKKMQGDLARDGELIQILKDHLLKVNPSNTSVEDAVAAIEGLAKKRGEDIG
ncbi:MAG: hypothetical protein KC733_10735 [Candidatus Omnitrophica bacterium]|nr:hypothetical protein [Candidatus Omnitrophota bacterium]